MSRQLLIGYNKSEKGRETSGRNFKYVRTDEHKDISRRNIIAYTKSENGREMARQKMVRRNKSENGRKISAFVGKTYGIPKMIEVKRSKEERKAQRKRMILHNSDSTFQKKRIEGIRKSEKFKKVAVEKGRTIGVQNFVKWARSEEGRENMRKIGKKYGGQNLAKANSYIPTKSQFVLSKALSDNGIYNELEWWVPECKRIIDIAILSAKLAIEVDGESHTDPKFSQLLGKSLEQKQADDKLKDQQLQSLGWKVLRFSNEDVKNRLQEIIKKVSIFV